MTGFSTHVPRDILQRFKDQEQFAKYVIGYFYSEANSAGVTLQISKPALIEAHMQWVKDLERISKFELDGSVPDHFKQAGHLTYWLRRSRPIIGVSVMASFPPAGNDEEIKVVGQFQEFMMRYPNEYLAFSLGFSICALHCQTPNLPAEEFIPDTDYLTTICQFLWNKNVSPHALFLIFKSLFFRK